MAKFTLSSLDVCGGVSVSVGPQILSPEISCRLTIAFASLVPQAPQSRVSRVIFGGWRELMLGILGYRVFVLLIWSKFAYDKVSLADGIAFDISVRWHQRTHHEGRTASEPRGCRRSRLKVSVVSIFHHEICFMASVCTGRSWTLHNRYRHDSRSARAREIRCAGGARIHDSRSLTPADWENRCASALQGA
jgi:hypothetical protein